MSARDAGTKRGLGNFRFSAACEGLADIDSVVCRAPGHTSSAKLLLLRPPADRVEGERRLPYEAGEILMSSRSERYLANAEKCQQYADAVNTFGTKRLYEELSRQWLRLAEQAEETGRIESPPTSAGRMPLRGPQPISLNTSAIN